MKKLFLIACVSLATLAVNASYLYWQVTDDVITTYNSQDNGAGYYFQVGDSFRVVNADTKEAVTTVDSLTGENVSQGYVGINYSSLVDSQYSYYIEMCHGTATIARSETISNPSTEWTAYADYQVPISANLEFTPTTLNTWHPTFTAVPEPTSAVLMLFGAAFLGLKRKNRSVA